MKLHLKDTAIKSKSIGPFISTVSRKVSFVWFPLFQLTRFEVVSQELKDVIEYQCIFVVYDDDMFTSRRVSRP